MAERIFVTGASGQIGLPLVRELVQRGHRVTGLVRTPGRADAVRQAGAEVVEGALSDRAAVVSGLEGATMVYHLAGGVHGKGRETADDMNRAATASLVEALAGVPLRSVVYASSMAVYGDRSGMWVPEDFPPSPQTKYGEAKVAAENLLLDAFRSGGLPVRIARLAAVYGPDINFMAVERLKAGRGWLPGEGKNLVPIVHVKDAVNALITIGETGKAGEVYHVAGKSTPMLKEFYEAVTTGISGQPMRFWSTWIPSGIQFRAAALNETICAQIGRKPRFTADNLKLYTASIRLRTERLEKELRFSWEFPDHLAGVADACGAP